MNNLEEKVLKEIKNKKPKPKWEFCFKNYIIWGLTILFVVFAAFAFSICIHILANNDWHNYIFIANNFWHFFLMTFPYFWLLFTIIFITISYLNFKKTEKGYKIEKNYLLLAVSLIILSLSIIMFFLGTGRQAERIPIKYNKILDQRMVIWNSPEKGSIAGTVIENRERFLKLEDFNRKIWFVDTTFIPFSDLTNKKVKIIGTDLGDNNFKAKRIIPWDQR